MAKRPAKKKTSRAEEIAAELEKDLAGLTPPDQIEEQTAEITGADPEPAAVNNKIGGRPVDPNKARRKKYTTMADPELIKRMKIDAINKGITTADLLEELMIKHLAKSIKIEDFK